MRAIGYVRVYTDQQADRGVSLQAQTERVKAMAIVQGADLVDIVVDGGESAKSMNRPGLQRILAMVEAGTVQAVIVAKLDRLTKREGHVLALELFEKRRVALISVAESLDTGSAAGRLVITIMGAVSQWEREAIGERTREALRHKGSKRERVGNIGYGLRVSADGVHVEECPRERGVLSEIQRLRSEGATMRGIAITLNTPRPPHTTWFRLAAGVGSAGPEQHRCLVGFCPRHRLFRADRSLASNPCDSCRLRATLKIDCVPNVYLFIGLLTFLWHVPTSMGRTAGSATP